MLSWDLQSTSFKNWPCILRENLWELYGWLFFLLNTEKVNLVAEVWRQKFQMIFFFLSLHRTQSQLKSPIQWHWRYQVKDDETEDEEIVLTNLLAASQGPNLAREPHFGNPWFRLQHCWRCLIENEEKDRTRQARISPGANPAVHKGCYCGALCVFVRSGL